jgi:hypothetical protein
MNARSTELDDFFRRHDGESEYVAAARRASERHCSASSSTRPHSGSDLVDTYLARARILRERGTVEGDRLAQALEEFCLRLRERPERLVNFTFIPSDNGGGYLFAEDATSLELLLATRTLDQAERS